jgi:flagellar M-ring protein FliF
VRSEQLQQSQTSGPPQAGGIPGVLSNTPPPATQATAGPPQGTAPAAPGAAPAPTNGESSTSKTYELGRQVSVSETGPGGIKRLTVAVAISADAMKGAKAKDLTDLEQLVSAAVGANPQRGDVVKIVTRSFEPVTVEATPFYETPWFAMVVRNGAAVLAVLLVLLLGVRPVIKAMRGDKPAKGKKGKKGEATDAADEAPGQVALPAHSPLTAIPGTDGVAVEVSRADLLARQLGLAQRIVAEKPESAVHVLRQMLAEPAPEAQTKAA